MLLHTFQNSSLVSYALFDSHERLVEHPTGYFRFLKKRGRRDSSRRHIAYILKQHCEWIEQNSSFEQAKVDLVIQSLESEDILDWISDQRDKGISETTVNNREALLREFYKWSTTADAGHIREDIPWGEDNFTKNPHTRLPRFVTTEQVIRLLRGLHNESQRAAVHFIYDTGVRVSELRRITNRCLPNEKHWPEEVNYYPLLVPGSKPRDGNKFKFRYSIISRPVLARVRRLHSTPQYTLAKQWSIFDPDKPTFLNVHGEELTEDAIQKAITDAWIRQGGNRREVSPHRLRHGTAFIILQSEFGKQLLDNLLVLKSMLGHADIRTTEVYTAIPIAALQSLAGKRQIRLKYAEAQQIYDATYLPAREHKERRGRRR
jgi:integrase/recombinase XerD